MENELEAPSTVALEDHLTPSRFVTDYLRANRPVVVGDAMNDWPAMAKWNVAYFESRIGTEPVQVEGDTFNSLESVRFSEYLESLASYEDLPPDAPQFLEEQPYVRRRSWTQQQQDTLHGLVADDWCRPYFLPDSLYLRPLDLFASCPNRYRYPYFGVYFSPRGAVTGLHVDPLRSSAVLCQVSGEKRGFLFPPRTDEAWKTDSGRLAAELIQRKMDVLRGERPDYGDLAPVEFVLSPGEVLYIPMGWAHEVFTTSNSISLTYNFIHLLGLGADWWTHPETRGNLRQWVRNRVQRRKSPQSRRSAVRSDLDGAG